MLKECKDNCDFLIVGLQTDPSIDRPEKSTPVQCYFERYLQLEAVKYIDKICPYETEGDLMQLLRHIGPDVRFIGEDWRGKKFTGKLYSKCNGKIFYNTRYGYSTTELKERISSK
jgi:glycerol-3-phosphate cytidylyltransferase